LQQAACILRDAATVISPFSLAVDGLTVVVFVVVGFVAMLGIFQ
jgi:hypothetical protein